MNYSIKNIFIHLKPEIKCFLRNIFIMISSECKKREKGKLLYFNHNQLFKAGILHSINFLSYVFEPKFNVITYLIAFRNICLKSHFNYIQKVKIHYLMTDVKKSLKTYRKKTGLLQNHWDLVTIRQLKRIFLFRFTMRFYHSFKYSRKNQNLLVESYVNFIFINHCCIAQR